MNKYLRTWMLAFILLFLAACESVETQDTASTQRDMQAQTVEVQPGTFTFLGRIGDAASYEVYRLEDSFWICYIVVDAYVSAYADTNSAPTIHCPYSP